MFKEIRSPEDYLEFFEVEEILRPLEWFGIEIPHDDLEHKWVKKEFSNGHYAIFQQKDGKRDGDYFQFHPDGHLEETILYHNGLENGLAKWYAPDGHLEAEEPYHNGLLEGTVKFYAPDGHLKLELSYHNGLKNGLEKLYHTDGKTLAYIAEIENGKSNGLSTYYRQDGSKLSEMKFEDGQPVGLERIFEEDGKTVAKEVPYTGTISEFGLNGKVISKTKYIDGVPEHETKGKLTSLFKELSEQKQEVVGGKIQEKTQEPTQQQSHVKEPEPQPKQGPQPQMPNWEIVGVGKTEILADSKEAFKKARQDKREAAQQANKKTSPKPQAPNQEEQKLRDFAAWEKEVEEAIAKAVAEWRERTKANVSDEEKVKTEQEAQQKPQPPRTPNTSQEYSYDLNFNSSRDVHLGQNGAMKIDFSTPAPKPNVPSGQTTDMQQTVQSNGQKQPISYMKKQFFNKGGSR